jgi:hypothetical protein
MNRKTIARKYIAALLTLAAAGSALAQEATPDQPVITSQLSRAEVIADLNLWKRAGVEAYVGGEADSTLTPGYQQALAEYRRLRSGPEYLAEVRRVADQRHETVAGTPAQRAQ